MSYPVTTKILVLNAMIQNPAADILEICRITGLRTNQVRPMVLRSGLTLPPRKREKTTTFHKIPYAGKPLAN